MARLLRRCRYGFHPPPLGVGRAEEEQSREEHEERHGAHGGALAEGEDDGLEPEGQLIEAHVEGRLNHPGVRGMYEHHHDA